MARTQDPKLTDKQLKFVDEYLVDLNAAGAARRAGYSEKTARTIASEYLTKPNIQAAIEARRAKLAKNTITPEQVVKQWMEIAELDMKDFLSWRTALAQVGTDEETGEPIFDYRPVLELKDSDKVDGRMVTEVSISDKGTFKFKLCDREKARENIAKHLGMFVEKQEISGPGGGELIVRFQEPDE